jgi:pimeloyl-ACP methyl ester carboxylesterase
MGGVITLYLAARRKRPLAGIVLVDAPIFLSQTPEITRALEGSLAAFPTPAYRDAARAVIDGFMFRPTSPPALRERLRERMVRTPQHVLESAWRNLWADHSDAAARVAVPALAVVAGDPTLDHERLRRSIANVQLGMTVGAAHFLQLEAPDQFNPMLRAFIDQLGAKR